MACEFLGHEIHTTGPKAGHQRKFCTQTFEACLVDYPLDYLNCTRRTWLLLQGVEPEPEPKIIRRAKRGVLGKSQITLL